VDADHGHPGRGRRRWGVPAAQFEGTGLAADDRGAAHGLPGPGGGPHVLPGRQPDCICLVTRGARRPLRPLREGARERKAAPPHDASRGMDQLRLVAGRTQHRIRAHGAGRERGLLDSCPWRSRTPARGSPLRLRAGDSPELVPGRKAPRLHRLQPAASARDFPPRRRERSEAEAGPTLTRLPMDVDSGLFARRRLPGRGLLADLWRARPFRDARLRRIGAASGPPARDYFEDLPGVSFRRPSS
jgi:hypothetical protein